MHLQSVDKEEVGGFWISDGRAVQREITHGAVHVRNYMLLECCKLILHVYD